MKKLHLNIYFLLLSLGLILSSCVGTIQDSEKKVSDTTIIKPVVLLFSGITKAVAVAHNKIQLNFRPASGGSNNYSYLVYQDGNLSTPVASASQSSLTLNNNGEYSISVSNGLALGTQYTFLVRVFDSQSNIQDTNNVQVSVQTLAYKTPIFDGIQSLENLAGKEGENALLVKWNPASAASAGGGLGGNVDSISGYNIYVGESEESLFFYTSVNDANATSMKLNGLDSGKSYFVRVRAKNSLPIPVEDLNDAFMTKKTFTHLPILFGGVTSVSVPVTSSGYSTINVQWKAGTGNYDRYKIFARKDPVSSFNQNSSDYLITTITNLALTSIDINVPDPHTVWYVAVVACSDAGCTESQGQNIIKYIKTSPPVATFNGIKTLTQPTGGDGLSALDLIWDLPDSTTGVYDEIRVFKSDINGNFDPFLDRIDNINYDQSQPNVTGVTLRSGTYVRVNGLETGKQVCFVALAYSTSPLDPSNADGRTGITRVVKCATPQYNIPGFAGVKLNCTNATAQTVKISWLAPTPQGTYEDFEIYYRNSSSGFVVDDAIAGLAGYTKKVVTSDQLTYTLTNLLMNSNYQVLVKSHFYNPVDDKHYRDNNSVVATCSTTSPLVEQGPWFELFAIGPKLNGLTGGLIPEKLTPLSGGIDGLSGSPVNKPEWRHQYPVESTGSDLGISESINGIVRIAWEDMLLSDNLGHLKDYNDVPDTGYKVYRVPHNSLYGSTGPALTDSAWGSPINSGFIQAPSVDTNIYNRYLTAPITKSIAQFVDYTLLHPYNVDSARANEATVYWYKIEPWYNGKKLAYSSIASDAVVRMVLPPKNMAFVHRWMSNKQICEDMGLPYIRSNNYKCEYTGLGAVMDPNDSNYYYDMRGDLLVDRFEMGCNFSRGGTDYACSNSGGMVGFEGDIDDIATGRKTGDCISRSSTTNPTNKISAKPGAVFYSRQSQECFVNTSSPASLVEGKGVTWSTLTQIDGNSYSFREYYEAGSGVANKAIINAGITKIPPSQGPTNTTFPVTVNDTHYAKYSQGMGYGARIYSNDAKLPVHGYWSDPISLYYTCQSSLVNVAGKSYPKKLSRRKEFIAYAAESPLLSQTERTLLEQGNAQRTNDAPLAVPIENYLTLPLSSHNDRDCNSAYTMYGYYNPVNGRMYNESNYATWTGGYAYGTKVKVGNVTLGQDGPGRFLDYNDPRWASGGNASEYSYLTTGSSGPLSSEACVSRFGIQDHLGNASEWTSDLFYCNPEYGCSMGFKNAAQNIPYSPPIDNDPITSQNHIPPIQDDYKNPNGFYYSVSDATSPGTGTVSMGTRLIPRNRYTSPNRNFLTDFECHVYDYSVIALTGADCASTSASYATATVFSTSKYFNVALGIPLDCEGQTCTYQGGSDSNTLVTPRTVPVSTTTLITRYQAGSSELAQMGRGGNTGVSATRDTIPFISGIVNGGDPRTSSTNSRYHLLFNGHDGYMHRSSGRCDVLLPEDL